MNALLLAIRFARRELRSGLSGFRIFLACLALGVAAIAGVGSLADAFLAGLAQEGRTLLGGDVEMRLVHRPADAEERAAMEGFGRISEAVSMRAMAYAAEGPKAGARELVELKAADSAYPLFGTVELSPPGTLGEALACKDDGCGAVVEQTLADRLGLETGAHFRVGEARFRLSAILIKEPDRVSGGFSLGPRVLVSDEGLARTGLVQLGSLINYSYRIAFDPGQTPDGFREMAQSRFPDAGWEIRDRTNAAPGVRRFVNQAAMFLTLVGLTALAVGGVGAGQAVSAFLDRKRTEIAILKSLGAEGALVFLVYFVQVMAVALVAVAIGIVAGAVMPYAVERFYGASIPAPADYGVYPGPLVLAAVFGVLAAAAFAVPPLARAREIAPASLFRDLVAPAAGRGRLPYLLAAGAAGVAVVALALALTPYLEFAAIFLGGAIGGFVALRVAAWGLMRGLRALPRPKRPLARLAIGNLMRPGATTAGVVVALGLGLTLLCTVALLDASVSAQVKDDLPERAPSFFFVDIQNEQVEGFEALVNGFASAADFQRTPMIRGRIVKLNGVPAQDAKVAPEARWVLNGDRGITYAGEMPADTKLAEGAWWPADYAGPTLVSFSAELGRGLGLKLGDTITLNVLGREFEAEVASLRDVDFTTGGMNFILVLSPGLIDKAPHTHLATVRVAPEDEEAVYRAVTDAFPNISVVRVREAIAEVNALVQELATGIGAASMVTILAGLFVLAGAIAAGHRARIYDSVVLKVLGATRGRLAAVFAVEYGVLGLLTGALALAAGTGAAWWVTRAIFDIPLVFAWEAALATVVGGAAATVALGLMGGWAALSVRPAARLRNP